MNMKRILIIIAILSIASCAKEAEFSVPQAQTSFEFEAAGATVFATVSTTDFKVECDDDWVYTQIYKGNKSHNLRISVEKNTMSIDRSSELILTPFDGSESATISLRQCAAEPFIKILKTTVSLEMDDKDFEISALSNGLFDVETPDWIDYKEDLTEEADTCVLHFETIGEVERGATRSGYITLTSKGTATPISAKAYVEQVGTRWEQVIMTWGLEDIQYIWKAFGKTTSAITLSTISGSDFSSYPRIKANKNGGFIYTNASGYDLYVVMSADAQFKINKASSKTSVGNINRDGENVERMQMSKATSGVGENSLMFIAPRTGVLEVEAASPNSGDKKPQVVVDGTLIEETFLAPYAIPSAITDVPIIVSGDKGAEVRLFGTNGAINYFRITYTFKRPVL